MNNKFNNFDAFFLKVVGVLLILGVILIIFMFIYSLTGKVYNTNIPTTCEDRDGDLIEGIICYDKIYCSNVIRFLNEEGCDDLTEEDLK